MALILLGKTTCLLCGLTLNAGQALKAFPAFLQSNHEYARFSDAAFHRTCFEALPEAPAVTKLCEDAFKAFETARKLRARTKP